MSCTAAVVFQNCELDDLIIARSDGTPTYNFCVVVDDMDMQITHVIRGDDHLNNTPRQLNMLLALGAQAAGLCAPADDSGCRRRQALEASRRGQRVAVSRRGIPARGRPQLPGSLGLVARRSGNLFRSRRWCRLFDIADVNKSASAFNFEKLAWLNQQHMMRAPPARIVPVLRWHLEREGVQAADEAQLEQIVLSQRERAKTVREMAQNSVFFFRAPATYDEKAVRKHVTAEVLALLAEAAAALEQLAGLVGAGRFTN